MTDKAKTNDDTTVEDKNVVDKLTDAVSGYFKALTDQPLQHGISMMIGAGIDRRMVTSTAKQELSDQAYAKLRSKIFLGRAPFVNA